MGGGAVSCSHSESSGKRVVNQIQLPPIENPFREKQLLERRSSKWLSELFEKLATLGALPPGSGIRGDTIDARVIEVYRMCYEQSPSAGGREKVVRDFAAHKPLLLFHAKWLQQKIRASYLAGLGPGNAKERLLKSIANGLRSAASNTSYTRALREMALDGSMIARERIKADLNDWDSSLERNVATTDWIRQQASQKTEELLHAYPRLDNKDGKELLLLLQAGRIYDASVLIAAKTFGVRERNLQSK